MIDTLDAPGVAQLAGRRKSVSVTFSDVAAVVSAGSCRVSVVVVAAGLCDAAEILVTCNRAKGIMFHAVPECANIINQGGIDEHRIARLVGVHGKRTPVSLWRRTLVGEPTKGFSAVLALDPNQSAVALKAMRTLEDVGYVTMSTDAGRYVAAWTEHAYLPKLRAIA